MSDIVLAYQKNPRPRKRATLPDCYGVYLHKRLTPRQAPRLGRPAASVQPPAEIHDALQLFGLRQRPAAAGQHRVLRWYSRSESAEIASYLSGTTSAGKFHLGAAIDLFAL